MRYTIDLLSALEQGSIGSSGDVESSDRVRAQGYHSAHGSKPISAMIRATSTTGKTVAVDFLGYTSDSTTSPVCDLYWYDSPHEFDLTSYSSISYFRVVLKYSDNSTLPVSEIASCEIDINYNWHIGSDGYPTNDQFIPLPEKAMQRPYPDALWRIDPDVNDGYPYNKLIPGMVPEPPSGAFMDATNLEAVYIPRTCRKIGGFAFTNTALKKVRIPADCIYYPTSFPPDCEIEYYGGGGEFGQLYDGEGYAVLDGSGARIYIKE